MNSDQQSLIRKEDKTWYTRMRMALIIRNVKFDEWGIILMQEYVG